MDYGHELLFGTFMPAAQRPHHAVELAVVADRAGLDLVTFQDTRTSRASSTPGPSSRTWRRAPRGSAQPQRAEPPPAAAGHAGPRRRARSTCSPAVVSSWGSVRADLGRDRGDGRAAPAPPARPSRRSRRRSRSSGKSGAADKPAVSSSTGSTTAPGARRADRAPAHIDVGIWVRAGMPHASSRRAEGGWLVGADPPVPAGEAADAGPSPTA